MTDIVPNPNTARSTVETLSGRLGEAVVFGQVLQRREKRWWLASAPSSEEDFGGTRGIAWASGLAGDLVPVVPLKNKGQVGFGAALLPSTPYAISHNPGGICPYGDVQPPHLLSFIGVADTAGQLFDLGDFATDALGAGGGAAEFRGFWDAQANDPDLNGGGAAPYTDGDYWDVSVAGTQTLGNNTDYQFAIGDRVIYRVDAPGNWVIVAAPSPLLALEGQQVLSSGAEQGEVLTAKGDGTSDWAAGGVEGEEVKSTGQAGGVKFLQEDGVGKSRWADLPVAATSRRGIIQASSAAGLSAASNLAVTNDLVSVDPDLSEDGGLLALRQDIEGRYVKPPPSDGRVYSYLDGAWIDTTPGYGGMRMSTPAAGSDIGAGWNPLTYFDQIVTDGPGIAFDVGAGTWQFSEIGAWQISINLAFEHNSDNSYRQTNLRFYNVTDGTPGSSVPFGAGRQAEDTMVSNTFQDVIQATDLNDVLRLEIGGGDSFTAVNYNLLSIFFNRITQQTTLAQARARSK